MNIEVKTSYYVKDINDLEELYEFSADIQLLLEQIKEAGAEQALLKLIESKDSSWEDQELGSFLSKEQAQIVKDLELTNSPLYGLIDAIYELSNNDNINKATKGPWTLEYNENDEFATHVYYEDALIAKIDYNNKVIKLFNSNFYSPSFLYQVLKTLEAEDFRKV